MFGRRPRIFRRRSTIWLLAAIVTLAVGLVLANLPQADDGPPAPTAEVSAPTPSPQARAIATIAVPTASPTVAVPDLMPDLARLQPVEVVDVIDGDTIDVRIPSLRSGQAGREERVRYYGVDTPERGDDCYREARQRNEALAGDRVLLLPDARERDPFGRLLRYAFTEDGSSIEARLIAEGLGRAWRQDGAYRDALVALEEAARTIGTGCLWQ